MHPKAHKTMSIIFKAPTSKSTERNWRLSPKYIVPIERIKFKIRIIPVPVLRSKQQHFETRILNLFFLLQFVQNTNKYQNLNEHNLFCWTEEFMEWKLFLSRILNSCWRFEFQNVTQLLTTGTVNRNLNLSAHSNTL